MIIRVKDKVIKDKKPELGEGVVLHIFGDSYVVKWYGTGRPLIQYEKVKDLRKADESR